MHVHLQAKMRGCAVVNCGHSARQRASPTFSCCSAKLNGRKACSRPAVLVRAEKKDQEGGGSQLQQLGEKASGAVSKAAGSVRDAFTEIDDNFLEYCSLDAKGGRRMSKMTMGEKEQEFLAALRSFYFEDRPALTNEEFDNLKEELLWQGSKVAVLSGTESRFLQASMAAAVNKPIISDEEYDELKAKLRNKNSKVVQQGPRCSLRSRAMYSDCTPDYLKMTALNIPAALVTLLALFSVDDITGFQITNLVELPEPYGIIFLWGAVFPALFIFVASITNFVFKDNLILKGSCPNCNASNSTYFGDILTVKGNRENNEVQCGDCKAKLKFDANKRQIKVEMYPGEGKKKPAAEGKKKSAASGNKKQNAEAGSKKESSKPQAA
ncbi:hypothetical protein WJX77_003319 [Trebouxia sp. C0004]